MKQARRVATLDDLNADSGWGIERALEDADERRRVTLENWRRVPDGFEVHPGLAPEPLMDAYEELWLRENADRPGGWPDCTPYMRHAEIRDLLLSPQVYGAAAAFVGEEVGLHLNLTGWVSTERTWHQDWYLNGPYVGDAYVGVWIALRDVDPDSGPLQVVPGSHRWPVMTRDDAMARLEPHERDDPAWPKLAERFVTAHWEREIAERGGEPWTFHGKRGDVLLWHPALVHRGSVPRIPGTPRPALIAHFTALSVREDMPERRREGAGWVFVIEGGPA